MFVKAVFVKAVFMKAVFVKAEQADVEPGDQCRMTTVRVLPTSGRRVFNCVASDRAHLAEKGERA